MKTAAICVVLALASCASTTSGSHGSGLSSRPKRLVAIDMYGTEQISTRQLLRACGKDLTELANELMLGKQADPEPVLAKIRGLGDFADVSPAFVSYPTKTGVDYYLTIDIVDRSDAQRLAFRGPFTHHHDDPEGLLGDWEQYESTVLGMVAAGTMSTARVSCPAFHCFGDHRDPAVRDLATRMFTRAPQHAAELSAIALDDTNPVSSPRSGLRPRDVEGPRSPARDDRVDDAGS